MRVTDSGKHEVTCASLRTTLFLAHWHGSGRGQKMIRSDLLYRSVVTHRRSCMSSSQGVCLKTVERFLRLELAVAFVSEYDSRYQRTRLVYRLYKTVLRRGLKCSDLSVGITQDSTKLESTYQPVYQKSKHKHKKTTGSIEKPLSCPAGSVPLPAMAEDAAIARLQELYNELRNFGLDKVCDNEGNEDEATIKERVLHRLDVFETPLERLDHAIDTAFELLNVDDEGIKKQCGLWTGYDKRFIGGLKTYSEAIYNRVSTESTIGGRYAMEEGEWPSVPDDLAFNLFYTGYPGRLCRALQTIYDLLRHKLWEYLDDIVEYHSQIRRQDLRNGD